MRVIVIACACSLALATLTTGAAAQTATKEPVLDRYPEIVRFHGTPIVGGHLEGFQPGDELTLERRRPEGSWRTVAIDAVNDHGRVRFELFELRRTASYRLVYVDPYDGSESTSESARIRVRPRLTVTVSPGHVMRGRTITVRGRLLPVSPDRSVAIRQRVEGEWRWMDTVRVRDGRFALRVAAHHTGLRAFEVDFAGDRHNAATARVDRARVYSPGHATWYGPGFYGRRTACGRVLGSETLGVAHRTLPCGTRVAILYRGRTVIVSVIDRGPYSGADWDLTKETAERLGFSGTDTIGVDPH